MKTISLTLIILWLCIGLISCDEVNTTSKDYGGKTPENGMESDSSNNLISKGHFDTMRTTWKENFRAYIAKDSLDYFEVPVKDLRAILDEKGLTDTRFYLGMEPDSTGVNRPHLMVVGLRGNVINTKVIADYSKLCPPFCPPPKI